MEHTYQNQKNHTYEHDNKHVTKQQRQVLMN